MKLQIVDILKKVLLEDGIKIRGVYERSDAKERLKEGMDRKKGFIGDEFATAREHLLKNLPGNSAWRQAS